jgi:hypothetical protein
MGTFFTKKKMRKTRPICFLLAVVFLLIDLGVHAQCTGAAYARLDVNKVSAQSNNSAQQYLSYINGGAYTTEYEVPKGSGKHTLFAASFWMGGLDPTGQLHLSASMYPEEGSEYYCGPYRSTGNYDCGSNFDTPAASYVDGMLWLSSGKVMNFYLHGFQVYDPQTLGIVQGVLPNRYENIKAIELPNGNVMLIMWRNSQTTASEVMLIDSSTFAVPVPDTLLYCQRFATMTLMPTGNVFLVGPFGTEEFNPITHTSVSKAPTLSVRQKHATMLLANGLVLVAGGPSAGVELYDPTNNTWTAGPALGNTRNYFPELTQRPGGDIWITGGNSTTRNTDVYNPVTNTITPGPLLPVGTRSHQIDMLNNTQAVLTTDQSAGVPTKIYIVDAFTGVNHEVSISALALPAAYEAGQLVVSNDTSTHFIFIDLLSERILGNRWQHVWNVRKDQVAQFQQDFANNTLNFANYRDIETWPGNGSAIFGEDAQLAPYIDVDFDGVYDPANDGDYPCFTGDQGLWWVYNDDGPHHSSGGLPFPMQLEVLAYAFDCGQTPCPDSMIDYTTMYHVEITNKSAVDYHDVYLGNFFDVDLGNPFDDYAASDSALGLAICYNGDVSDDGPMGYGSIPPATGYLCLPNGQIDHMGGFMSCEECFASGSNPTDAQDRYNFLSGYWADSTHIVNNGLDGHDSTAAGPPTNFMLSGDPGWCGSGTGNGGWTEFGAGNTPYDRRKMQNFGPFNLASGASIDLDFAILYSRATTGDNLTSVCKLRNDAIFLKDWWVNTMDRSCLTINNPITPRQATQLFKIVPNPNAGLFDVEFGKAAETDLQLELLNLQGQVVLRQTILVGEARVRVDASSVPKGVYLLRTLGLEHAATQKVVVK